MKKVTILKTFTFLMGWIISLQCLGKGLNLMNKPNNLYFTLGFILELGIIVGTFYFAFKFGWSLAKLYREYSESRKNKQEKVGESK